MLVESPARLLRRSGWMMSPEKAESLRPKLDAAQKALEAALEEACDTDVATADSAELMQLEESLTVARESARNTIELLQRLNRERQDAGEPGREHRRFVDDRGVQWDAFSVYPSRATSGRHALPSPYHEGWLSLQCADEIRRLSPIPEGWRELPPGALCELLSKATIAPRRKRSLGTPADPREHETE